MTCRCGHSLEEHDETDDWWSEGAEDEISTNDACRVCGRFDFDSLFKCMHYEENKK